MKKTLLTILASAVLLAGLVFGPDAVHLYWLDRYLTTSVAAYEANGGPWPRKADACTGCHGVDGNSVNAAYPSLAGQPAAYLSVQLRQFADGQRANSIMNAMARSLEDRDIDALAAHFARQPVIANRDFEPDAALQEQGRSLVMNGACASCHGEGLGGRTPFPALAGQSHGYLLAQLDGFAEGTRRDPSGAMNALAASWSPDQRRAIALYLAIAPTAASASLTTTASRSP